jgi:hypothetical protein
MDEDKDSDREASSEQSTAPSPKKGVWQIEDSDGPYCPLTTEGRQPRQFYALVHMSKGARLARQKQRAELDAEILRDMLAQLEKALASPSPRKKLSADLLAQVTFLIRNGIEGSIPVSWVPKELQGEVPVSVRTRLTDPRVRTAAYTIAVERGYIRDPTRQQTVIAETGKSARTRKRWNKAVRKAAEEELDAFLLQYPMFLYEEDGRSLGQVLLAKEGVTIKVPFMA